MNGFLFVTTCLFWVGCKSSKKSKSSAVLRTAGVIEFQIDSPPDIPIIEPSEDFVKRFPNRKSFMDAYIKSAISGDVKLMGDFFNSWFSTQLDRNIGNWYMIAAMRTGEVDEAQAEAEQRGFMALSESERVVACRKYSKELAESFFKYNRVESSAEAAELSRRLWKNIGSDNRIFAKVFSRT